MRGAGVTRRALHAVLPWAAAIVSLSSVVLPLSPAWGADFRRLNAAQIRSRIVGQDITDDFHWTEHYRRDGVLVFDDMGRRRSGRWKIERDMLCMARETGSAFNCFQVWTSGAEVSLRTHETEQTPPAFIRQHEGR